MLKLHGSLNWLNCSNCGRLFVENENIGVQKLECQYCNTESNDNTGSKGNADSKEKQQKLLLEPLIITPTLLKELSNLHIKSIWQNAFIELQEARDIYFIGYSLPFADFEFKYILKKAIHKDANINVVLSYKDKRDTKRRYKEFLGNDINFNFDGFGGWVNSIDSL